MNVSQHDFVAGGRVPAAIGFRTIHDAEALLSEGRRSAAAEVCHELLQADPHDGDATNVLGLIAVSEGRDEAAIDIFQTALRHQQRDSYWVNLGTIHSRKQLWAEAESSYRQALELKQDNALTWRKLGAVLEKRERLDEACDAYRNATAIDPAAAEPRFALGAALYSARRFEEALASDREAVALRPESVAAFTRIGGALRSLGRPNEALQAFERAKAIDGKLWSTHTNIGAVLRDLGRFEEACEAYRSAIALGPGSAQNWLNLGFCLRETGRLTEACDAFRKSTALAPDYAAFRALGIASLQLGRGDAACSAFRRVVELRPDQGEAHAQLGDAFRKLARLEEACVAYRTALVFEPDKAATRHGLALALRGLGRFAESREAFQKALALNPNSAEMHNNYANVIREFGLLEEACTAYRQALAIRSDYPEAMTNLATALKDQGKLSEAVDWYEAALVVAPDLNAAHGNLLFAQPYRPGTTLAGLALAHRAWNDRFARPLKSQWPKHRPARVRARPRLGFVSADFNNHPVGYFVVQLMETLRRKGADFVCYANQTRSDALTDRFRASASAWRDIAGLSDDAVVKQILADEIDILFDMSGFMSGNRLLIFARKPAPVQVTWFGYMATTGVEAIDYILADRHHIPAGSDRFYSEKVVRLPNSLVCFDPPANAPPVTPLPALRNGHVTFGSFNVLCKITPQVVEVWSRILRRKPGSRLVVKTAALSCPATRARYAAMFAAHEIAPERLTFEGRTSRAAHMAATAAVDIALDPFPYVGCTTTAECAFMGVPVVTMPGELFSSRHSLSLLTTMGMTETIVDSLQSYEEVAVALANDLERLASLRAGLRDRMLASPLCDAELFTQHFEEACARMWAAYREGETPRPGAVSRRSAQPAMG